MSEFITEVTRALNHPDATARARLFHFLLRREEREEELRRLVFFSHVECGGGREREHGWLQRVDEFLLLSRNADLEIPNVLGFIDGTLVRIVPTKKDEHRQAYFCRKGYPALYVQILSGADLCVLEIKLLFLGFRLVMDTLREVWGRCKVVVPCVRLELLSTFRQVSNHCTNFQVLLISLMRKILNIKD